MAVPSFIHVYTPLWFWEIEENMAHHGCCEKVFEVHNVIFDIMWCKMFSKDQDMRSSIKKFCSRCNKMFLLRQTYEIFRNISLSIVCHQAFTCISGGPIHKTNWTFTSLFSKKRTENAFNLSQTHVCPVTKLCSSKCGWPRYCVIFRLIFDGNACKHGLYAILLEAAERCVLCLTSMQSNSI